GEKEYRSLKASDDVLTITIERALELLSEPKKGRSSSGSKSKAAEKELGPHPEDGEPVNIYKGPYGPYIKHGKTNVRIPEEQSVEDMSLASALELLASKASTAKSGKSTRKTTSKSTSKSTTSSSKSSTKSSTTTGKKTKKAS
ncbi:MAG TPA: topoisomerase C-terminal repeat-containing protein, partial [Coleofasciculaceae cyanobacterium]